MDSGQELELEVRRLLSSEVQEHREFLQSQIKYVSWGAGILLTLTIALLGYYFGKSLPETKAQLLAAIDAKVIDYRILQTVEREIRSAQNSTAEQLLERVSLPKGAVL